MPDDKEPRNVKRLPLASPEDLEHLEALRNALVGDDPASSREAFRKVAEHATRKRLITYSTLERLERMVDVPPGGDHEAALREAIAELIVTLLERLGGGGKGGPPRGGGEPEEDPAVEDVSAVAEAS